jgi:hypothetical protein
LVSHDAEKQLQLQSLFFIKIVHYFSGGKDRLVLMFAGCKKIQALDNFLFDDCFTFKHSYPVNFYHVKMH